MRGRTVRGLLPYAVLVLVGTVPAILLGVYAHAVAADSVNERTDHIVASTAHVVCELVASDIDHRVRTLEGFAGQRAFAETVAAGDEDEVRRQLGVLVQAHPRVVRAFVTDPEALLWSDWPRAPESLGRRFAERDWYRGVSAGWTTHVSEVYRRHAAPEPLLVAIAAPVRDPNTDEVGGIVVYQVLLEGILRTVRGVEAGPRGEIIVLDASGTVAAHTALDLQARLYDDYANSRVIQEMRADPGRAFDWDDPVSGVPMRAVAETCDIGGRPWTVIAQQPVDVTRRPVAALGGRLLAAGGLFVLLVACLGAVLARIHGRTLRARDELERENAERRRAERELQEARDNLEDRVRERTRELEETRDQLVQAQKMEAVGRLAGGVAHDFNNLLSVVIGYAEVALDELPEDSPLREPLLEIHKAGDRAGSLTRQLLAFSRSQVLQQEIVNLNHVVHESESLLRRVIGEDIDLKVTTADDLHPVECDPGQVQQIILNLAVNARDAMPDGGRLLIETANVQLDEDYIRRRPAAHPGPHVMLAVTDTGVGMDEATQERIFEPFFSTKQPSEGSGLGLSTVYGIVKQSGGTIWTYSEPGRGTTFKIYLPAQPGRTVPEPAVRREPSEVTGTETILVVEDEPAVRELVSRALRSAGYTVVAARDGDEALAASRDLDGALDLVLTDVVLPGISGPELVDALRSERDDLAVLFMSGYTDESVVQHGVLEEGARFYQKPVRPKALLGRVRDVLDSRED